MADISLRDYLAKLDNLLSSQSAPEVILHARHILQHFPRNAQTYRLLGRSLVATTRWPEAAEVMRRVLSVFPDDKVAHAGMSEVYRLEKRTDDAIWHLERAFEQSPNDQIILDNLRELYRKHRKVEHGKVQLTAGAVARQYVRNGLYEQALDTLQKAIAAAPERVDLRLLLAQTYWDAGRRVEAGETALEVLRTLPDCLVANTLMAALWLTEARPSDAQRYINRIQSLDPYLALELAQGQDVPDETFTLAELDYQKAAERELVAQTPDWLKGIDAATAAVMSADLDSQTNADDILAGEGLRRSRTTEQDMFGELGEPDALFDEQTQPPPGEMTSPRAGLTDRLVRPQTGSLPAERPVPGPRKGLTGRLTPPPEEPLKTEPTPSFMADLMPAESVAPSQEELPQWLDASAPDIAADIGSTAQADLPDWMQANPEADDLPFRRQRSAEPDHEDPLAWLRESGIEVTEPTSAPADDDLFGTADDSIALQDADAVDPLSWMQSYGGKDRLMDSSATADETRLMDDAVPGDDDSDPLAWLQQADVEPAATGGNMPTGFNNDAVPGDDESDPLDWLQQADAEFTSGEAAAESAPVDPLDWLADDTMLDEALDLESLVDNRLPPSESLASVPAVSPTAETPEWQDNMPDEKDPLDWLSSSEAQPAPQSDESFTWSDQTTPESGAGEGEFPDWLTSTDEAVASLEGDDGSAAENLDWMSSMPSNEAESTQPVKTGNTGMLDWLNKAAPETASLPPTPTAGDNVPDWLNEMQTEIEAEPSSTPVVDENGFEWMSQSDDMPSAVSADSNPPDWLSAMNIADEVEALAEDAPLAAAEVPDWLTQTQMGDESLVEAQAAANEAVPDWLGELNISGEAEMLADAVGNAPEWTDEIAEAAPLASADDSPDWLADLKPVDATPAMAENMSITSEWLSEMNTPEMEEPPEADTITQMPGQIQDWVANVRAQSEDTVLEDDAPDWLAAMQPEDAAEAEPEAMMSDTPDWLAAMKPEDESEVQAEPQAAMSDTPDWLAAMQPADEVVAEAEPEPMMSDTPDWLAAMQPTDEVAAEAESEPMGEVTPGWLMDMQSEAMSEAKVEPEAVMSDSPDWLADLQPEGEVEAEAAPMQADEPDWLAAMQSESTTLDEPEPASVASDTPDWLAELQPEETTGSEVEPEPMAEAAPDWLAAMQAAGDVTNDLEPVVNEEPDWLAEMTSETDESAPVAQRPISSAVTRDLSDWTGGQNLDFDPTASASEEPDWLTNMASDAVPEPAPDEMMSDDVMAAMDEVVTENATDMPDWLTAMRPTEAAAAIDSQQGYDWEAEPGDGEFMPAAPAPAQNAPDWLNAMVPGLDVDYEAEEDEPLETEFLPGSENRVTPVVAATPAKARPEYSWLLDIVQEESQHIRAVGQQSARRFVFSRLPAWLRKPTEARDEVADQADADNVDIPPWLQ